MGSHPPARFALWTNRALIARPNAPGNLTWWSHVLVQGTGVNWWNCLRSAITSQGFENFQSTARMDMFLQE
jgi:hypothetical protein